MLSIVTLEVKAELYAISDGQALWSITSTSMIADVHGKETQGGFRSRRISMDSTILGEQEQESNRGEEEDC